MMCLGSEHKQRRREGERMRKEKRRKKKKERREIEFFLQGTHRLEGLL